MESFRFNDEKEVREYEQLEKLRKEIVLQEAKCFNDNNLNVRNCVSIITKLLYLLNQDEKFTDNELESLFFSITKLFQSTDQELRRMVYLIVKNLNVKSTYSYVITGVLMTDINKNNNMFRANSFQILGKIMEISNITILERFLKNAISDKLAYVSSSAIICSLKIALKGSDIAKNWINELNEKLKSSMSETNLLTFHTMLLLFEIKKSDKLYIIKLIQNFTQSNLKSQLATCQLIRYIGEITKSGEIEQQTTLNGFIKYLESSLTRNGDAVALEAARVILEIPKVKETLITSAIGVLNDMLLNTRNILRYSALKTIDKVARTYSNIIAVSSINNVEQFLEDTNINMSMKSLAISIFMKISQVLPNRRLEKLFSTFCSQYTHFKDEFKREIMVISRNICQNSPQQRKLYFDFFSSCLKLDANFETKDEIVNSIIWFITNTSEFKKEGLTNLAELIEDCQYDSIKTKILNILGKEGLALNNSSFLVRHIYNRIILESSQVRAAAITTLAQIAKNDPSILENVKILIRSCINDADDEVRERAFLYSKALEDETSKNLIFNDNAVETELVSAIISSQKDTLLKSSNIFEDLRKMISNPTVLNLEKIESQDKTNVNQSSKNKTKDVSSTVTQSDDPLAEYKKTNFGKTFPVPKNVSKSVVSYFYINFFKRLTDKYAEYPVSLRKLVFENVVILDFEISNTIDDYILNNVTIEILDITGKENFDFSKAEIIEINNLKINQSKHLYLKLNKKSKYSVCSFKISLKFNVQEIDAKGTMHGDPYSDVYQIGKKAEVKISDYLKKNPTISQDNFDENWKLTEKSNFKISEEKYNLPYEDMKVAGSSVSELFGLEPLSNLDKVDKSVKKYEFQFAAASFDESLTFIKLQILFNNNNNCFAKLIIRSQDDEVIEALSSCFE